MKGTINLENIGKMPVESLNISVTSKDGEGKELTHFTPDSRRGGEGDRHWCRFDERDARLSSFTAIRS